LGDIGNKLESKTQSLAALISPDESQVAISVESMVQLWWVDPWELQTVILVGTKSIGSMAYLSDGRLLAVGSADKKIRIWSLA
jgi:WD40 repeat protein